ncbi:MAG: hypothetical protein IJ123_04380 [Blautia sp.]|nr:hypothetical protein [Blautia sp.]
MKEKTRRIAACAVACITSASLLAGCGSKEIKIDGTKTAATINGTEVPMGLLSLMTRYQQGNQEYMYQWYSSMYGMEMSANWNEASSSDENKTNGEELVDNVLDQLKVMYVSKEKAADYDITLSDEINDLVAEKAAAFMEANSEEAIALLGVTEDQVKEYLELQAYTSLVSDAVKEEAPIEITDDEVNQSSFTYVLLSTAGEEVTDEDKAQAKENAQAILDKMLEDPTQDMDEVAKSVDENLSASSASYTTVRAADDADEGIEVVEEAAEEETVEGDEPEAEVEDTTVEEEAAEDTDASEEAAAEDTAAEEDASVEEDAEEEDAAAEEDTAAEEDKAAEEDAAVEDAPAEEDTAAEEDEAVEEDAAAEEAVAEDEAAEEEYEAEEMDPSNYPLVLIDALRELSDGEMVPEVIETNSGYYVARLDLVFDEAATESERESLTTQQQNEYYSEISDEWKESVDFTSDAEVLKTLVVSDDHRINLTFDQEETEETEEAAEDETSEESAETESEDTSAEEAVETENEDTASEEADETESEDKSVEEAAEGEDAAAEEAVEAETEETSEEAADADSKDAADETVDGESEESASDEESSSDDTENTTEKASETTTAKAK